MYNLPICKQNSLNGFDYSIYLAESKKQSLEHVQKSSFSETSIYWICIILISIKSNSSIHALISFTIQE